MKKILLLFLFLSFYLYPLKIFKEKLQLEKKILNQNINVSISGGIGFYYYRDIYNNNKFSIPVPTKNYGARVIIKSFGNIFQGIDFNYFNLYNNNYTKFIFNSNIYEIMLSGYILNFNYIVYSKKYYLNRTLFSVWNFQKYFIGIGPSYFLSKIKKDITTNSIQMINDNFSHTFGVTILTGLSFSLSQLPISFGLTGKYFRMFSKPDNTSSISGNSFWMPFEYHQNIFSISFICEFGY